MGSNMSINLDENIIPGKSIGSISLGDNVNDIIKCIEAEYCINVIEFENFGVKYLCYKINDGAISFTVNDTGHIVSL
ncbi:hypothetical protein J7S97_18710, partial [Proteus mirabilis]|nr:hypothetical protein [Proteus mirabilis]